MPFCPEGRCDCSYPNTFERWVTDNLCDITTAVLPAENRVYADPQTQAAFDAWNVGAASVARVLTECAVDTPALRERIRELAGAK
jgi:hypothetical protein